MIVGDEAIQSLITALDCFAPLAMTGLRRAMANGDAVRHCDDRSDEAIQGQPSRSGLSRFAGNDGRCAGVQSLRWK
jgi:hypothetical protein